MTSGPAAIDARTVLEISTRGGAGCLGREGELGELSVGAVGDVAIWKLDGPIFAGVLDDLVEGWLRTGPHAAWHTIVGGRSVVEAGMLLAPDLDEKLAAHTAAARRFQPTA